MVDERLVAGIRESLAAESYIATYLFQCAHQLYGYLDYDVLHDIFMAEHDASIERMHDMANLLHGYTEETKVPAIDVPVVVEVKEMLEHLYQNECWAVERYSNLTKLAEELDDIPSANVFQTLADVKEGNRKTLVVRMGYIPGEGNVTTDVNV